VGRAKLRSYGGLEPAVVRRRLGGFLGRRGYDGPTVRLALDRLIGDESGDDGDELSSDE
jgi:hypothetical protein